GPGVPRAGRRRRRRGGGAEGQAAAAGPDRDGRGDARDERADRHRGDHEPDAVRGGGDVPADGHRRAAGGVRGAAGRGGGGDGQAARPPRRQDQGRAPPAPQGHVHGEGGAPPPPEGRARRG